MARTKTQLSTTSYLTRLGTAVRKERERRGWSTSTLADLIDISDEQLRLIEDARRDPDFSVAARIIIALDLVQRLPAILVGQKVASSAAKLAAAA